MQGNDMKLDGWNVREDVKVSYVTDRFVRLPSAILSAQKTYDEGVDVVRSIHQSNGSYLILVTAESRTSGPSEVIEKELPSLDDAKVALAALCREDDEFYQSG